MILQYLIFMLSAVCSFIILYILGIIWFGDRRNQMVRSFFLFGIVATYWIVFNGILVVSSSWSYPVMLSAGMIFVCGLPFVLLWFSLHYTRSRLVHSKPLLVIIFALPAIDIFIMLTNNVHKLFFTDYSYPIPGKGILYWVHVWVGLSAVLLAFFIIIVYVYKPHRNRVLTFFAALGILISTGLHISLAFDPLWSYDFSAIGFFATFLLFAFASYRSRIFRIRTASVDQIFCTLDDIVFIFDKDGFVIENNAIARSSFPQFSSIKDSITVKKLVEHLAPRIIDCTPVGLLDTISEMDTDCAGDIRLASEDGGARTFALRWRIMRRKSMPCGYVLSLSDTSSYHDMIDEIKKKNESLLRLNEDVLSASKAKSAFLANMSHEIRTPLNAIIGMSRIAKDSLDDIDKSAASIDQVLGASKHLLELLNNILDMSKIESGKFSIAEEPFSIRKALDEVVDIFTQRCNENSITLKIEFDEFPAFVTGDALRLKQVIINLLGNAVKFTNPDGIIWLVVNATRTEQSLNLDVSVRDTGIGMTQEQISRLFVAFEQADNSISARYGGTGIGLALSQHLVGMMGGEISVKSEPKMGSEFSFAIELPIETEPGSADENLYVGPPDLSGKRVLIVDDVEVNRIIMAEFLLNTNAAVDEACDGAEALELVRNKPGKYYDLIFMDVQMPNMDGYESTRQIRAIPHVDTADMPIVAMTANAYREDVERALESGMIAHLAKPIDIEKVYSLLAELIITD